MLALDHKVSKPCQSYSEVPEDKKKGTPSAEIFILGNSMKVAAIEAGKMEAQALKVFVLILLLPFDKNQ